MISNELRPVGWYDRPDSRHARYFRHPRPRRLLEPRSEPGAVSGSATPTTSSVALDELLAPGATLVMRSHPELFLPLVYTKQLFAGGPIPACWAELAGELLELQLGPGRSTYAGWRGGFVVVGSRDLVTAALAPPS